MKQNKEQTADKEIIEKVLNNKDNINKVILDHGVIDGKVCKEEVNELDVEKCLIQALSLKEQDTIKKLTTECNNCVMMLKQQGKQELWDDIMRCRTCNGDVTWKVLHTLSLKHKLIAKTYDDLKQKRHNLK